MKISPLLILFSFFYQNYLTQNFAFANFDSLSNTVELKWYTKGLIVNSGVDIYRKEEKKTWQKLNTEPLEFGKKKIPPEDLLRDSVLQAVYLLCDDPSSLKGIALLAVMLKTFDSPQLAQYLGMDYVDSNVQIGKNYLYKFVEANALPENGFSECEITPTHQSPRDEAPRNIELTVDKSQVSISVLPEQDRYYGVKIYRRRVDSLNEVLLTPIPVMIGQTGSAITKQLLFQDHGVQEGFAYVYRIQALNFFNKVSDFSKPHKAYIPDKTAPSAPSNCEAKVSGRVITYSWQKKQIEPDLLGFNVYRTTKNDTDFQKINKKIIGLNSTTARDSVNVFQSYMYKISAIDKSGNEKFSSEKQIEVYDNEPPRCPQKLIARGDSGKITLTWSKNQEEDLWGYLLYRSINDTSIENFVKITPEPLKENYFEDRLAANAKNLFLYKIVAIDQTFNRSNYSGAASARMKDLQAPSSPFITHAAFEKEGVAVEWFANPEKDLANYLLKRSHVDPNGLQVTQYKLEANRKTFFDSKYKSAQTYTYQLFAVDSGGNQSKRSNEIVVKVPETTASEKEKDLNLHLKHDLKTQQIYLNWDKIKSDKLLGYVIFKRTDAESQLSPVTGKVQTSDYQDSKFDQNQNCYYQVRAYLSDGRILYSKTLKTKPSK